MLCRTESRRFTHTTQGSTTDNTKQHYKVTGAPARVTERDASTQQPTNTRGGDKPPATREGLVNALKREAVMQAAGVLWPGLQVAKTIKERKEESPA